MRVLAGLLIIAAICYADMGVGLKLRNDIGMSTASLRFLTPQGIGFDGQLGFVFDGGDMYLFGGQAVFPMMGTKNTSFNFTGGLLYSHYEIATAEIDLLEIFAAPEVSFSFPNVRNLVFELGIPVFSIGFDLENDETTVSICAEPLQFQPIIGFHYYF